MKRINGATKIPPSSGESFWIMEERGWLGGGYTEFLEHAQLHTYYGVTSSMTSELMKAIVQENLGSHTEKELEKEALKDLIDLSQVWITNTSAPACYNLIPILTCAEAFGMHTEISLALFGNKQAEENLQILVTETRRWCRPSCRVSPSICTRAEEAFH